MAEDVLLALEGVGVRYGATRILSGIDLALARGRVTAILGPNGRGKTSLVKLLVGAMAPSEGRRRAAGAVGWVPQAGAPTFDYPVREMVLMGRARRLGLFGSPSRADYACAENALVRLGLAHLAERGVGTLSGGERQLVMVARALAGGCDVLVLDEPASALDLRNQRLLLDTVADLARADGLAIAFTTHAPGHALAVADDCLLMHADGAHERGPAHALLDDARLTRLYGTPVRVVAEDGPAGRLAAAIALPEGAA